MFANLHKVACKAVNVHVVTRLLATNDNLVCLQVDACVKCMTQLKLALCLLSLKVNACQLMLARAYGVTHCEKGCGCEGLSTWVTITPTCVHMHITRHRYHYSTYASTHGSQASLSLLLGSKLYYLISGQHPIFAAKLLIPSWRDKTSIVASQLLPISNVAQSIAID